MNGLIKYIDIKLVSVFLLAGFFLISESNAHARFMKKVVVDPILNPKDWQRSFDPGAAFTLMLDNSLAKSGQFQMTRAPKVNTIKNLPNLFKNPESNKLD